MRVPKSKWIFFFSLFFIFLFFFSSVSNAFINNYSISDDSELNQNQNYDFNYDIYNSTNPLLEYDNATLQIKDFNNTIIDYNTTKYNNTQNSLQNDIQFNKLINNTQNSLQDDILLNTAINNSYNSYQDNIFFENSTTLNYLNATPNQFDNFSFIKGSGNTIGNLEFNDNDFCIIDSYHSIISESLLGYIVPESDITTNWNEGDSTPHATKLDEAPEDNNGDDGNIRETSVGVEDSWHFTTLDLSGQTISQMVVYMYLKEGSASGTRRVYMYSSLGSIYGYFDASSTSYQWKTLTKSSLSYSQAQLDAFTMTVFPDGDGGTWQDIEAIYVAIYITANYYSIDFSVSWSIPEALLLNNLYYDYRTTSSVDLDLDIYNYDTTNWLELVSNTLDTYITNIYELSNSYISEFNEITVRFQTDILISDFDIEIDMLMFNYINDFPIYDKSFNLNDSISLSNIGYNLLYFEYNSNETISLQITLNDYNLIYDNYYNGYNEFNESIDLNEFEIIDFYFIDIIIYYNCSIEFTFENFNWYFLSNKTYYQYFNLNDSINLSNIGYNLLYFEYNSNETISLQINLNYQNLIYENYYNGYNEFNENIDLNELGIIDFYFIDIVIGYNCSIEFTFENFSWYFLSNKEYIQTFNLNDSLISNSIYNNLYFKYESNETISLEINLNNQSFIYNQYFNDNDNFNDLINLTYYNITDFYQFDISIKYNCSIQFKINDFNWYLINITHFSKILSFNETGKYEYRFIVYYYNGTNYCNYTQAWTSFTVYIIPIIFYGYLVPFYVYIIAIVIITFLFIQFKRKEYFVDKFRLLKTSIYLIGLDFLLLAMTLQSIQIFVLPADNLIENWIFMLLNALIFGVYLNIIGLGSTKTLRKDVWKYILFVFLIIISISGLGYFNFTFVFNFPFNFILNYNKFGLSNVHGIRFFSFNFVLFTLLYFISFILEHEVE